MIGGVWGSFGAVTGVLGCLAVFESDGASLSAQSVLAMRVIDAVVVQSIRQSLVCEAVACICLFVGLLWLVLTAVPFLFWFWLLLVPCSFTQIQNRRATLLQKRSTRLQGSAASTASYVRSLLCCCVRISWPLLYDAVRPPRWRGLGVGSVLLTWCYADADSGVRVFVGTIDWLWRRRRRRTTDPDDRC